MVRQEKTAGRNTEIIYKVPGPTNPPEWLGYIRFSGKDGLGTVEITNRKATFRPGHLDLGGTWKASDKDQAGAHGEGLKVALLVMMRRGQNHRVRCWSGGFNWFFDFTTQGKLVTRLRRLSPENILKAREKAGEQAGKTLIPVAASPTEDVQLFIGENGKGRDSGGTQVRRDQVRLEEFQGWLKAAVFLQDVNNERIVCTKYGDLITEPRLRGNIYLKGLLLAESTPENSASRTGKYLAFGYNFAVGSTNRERECLSSDQEESRAIMSIWSQALVVKPALVKALSHLLNSTNTYADVSRAAANMKVSTAFQLKQYLFQDRHWYYTKEEKTRVRSSSKLSCKMLTILERKD